MSASHSGSDLPAGRVTALHGFWYGSRRVYVFFPPGTCVRPEEGCVAASEAVSLQTGCSNVPFPTTEATRPCLRGRGTAQLSRVELRKTHRLCPDAS